jgi:hypothetical protein
MFHGEYFESGQTERCLETTLLEFVLTLVVEGESENNVHLQRMQWNSDESVREG